ncbi:hypothetical protein [Streptococcus thoraltensis]|uniref:hypothetical protein n=1 Tax=Streptococcus thoraltensis TaxID=55085 RepID=UPI001F57117D|nr:hypothetical protein [Streptococcus thoraltensis]
MIAKIRTHNSGNSQFLCELDVMKFTEDQIRERMAERGIRDDAFFICGFSDWEVDTIMSLEEAYVLKRYIQLFCDGDAYLVQFMLQRHMSLKDIVGNEYLFVSKDEKETIKYLFRHETTDRVVDIFCQAQSKTRLMALYFEQNIILNTPKGFYVRS